MHTQITTRAIAKSMLADFESGLPGLHEWSDGAMKKLQTKL